MQRSLIVNATAVMYTNQKIQVLFKESQSRGENGKAIRSWYDKCLFL